MVVGNKNHKKHQEYESYAICRCGHFRVYGRTFNRLYEKEQEPSPIKCWEWNHIDDRQIDRDKRSESKNIYETEINGVCDNPRLYNSHRTKNIIKTSLPDEKSF